MIDNPKMRIYKSFTESLNIIMSNLEHTLSRFPINLNEDEMNFDTFPLITTLCIVANQVC